MQQLLKAGFSIIIEKQTSKVRISLKQNKFEVRINDCISLIFEDFSAVEVLMKHVCAIK